MYRERQQSPRVYYFHFSGLPGLFIISEIWLVFNPDHNSMPGTDNNAIVEVNK